MAEKKDNTGEKNLTDDLLEGFDETFDDALEDMGSVDNEGETSNGQVDFVDKGSPTGDKTEVLQNDSERTEFALKEDKYVEKTEVVVSEPDEPLQVASRPSIKNTEMHSEDLSSLFEDASIGDEGKTEDAQVREATRNARQTVVSTEDVESLVPGEAEHGPEDTESFQGRTEDLSSMIDNDLLDASGVSSKKEGARDLSSLFDGNQMGREGKTEDLSSLIESSAGENNDDSLENASTKTFKKIPEPPKITPASKVPTKKEAPVAKVVAGMEQSLSFIKAELPEKIKSLSKSKKIMLVAAGACLLVGGTVWFFVLRVKQVPTAAVTKGSTASDPEKFVESEELLRDLEEKYQKASQYFVTDQFQAYSEATKRLEEILATFPNHKKANARLVEAMLLQFDGYLDADRKNRVYQLIEKAESVDSNSVETLRAKARLLMVEDKLKDASVRILQAVSLDPKDFESLQTQGEIALAGDDAKGALILFSKAMELSPTSIRAKYFYFLTKEKLGNTKEAKVGFAQLASDLNKHPKSHLEELAIAIREEHPEKIRTDLGKYLTDAEKDLSPYQAAQGWKIISTTYLKEGNTQDAIDALEKSVSKMALDHKAAFELGNLYFKQKNYQKASQHFSTSVTLDPDNVKYLMQLGMSLREQGQLKEAEEQLKKVTTKAPKDFEGLYQYALTKYRLGFVDDVVSQLELNIKENPDFLQGKVLLGIIQVEKGDYKNSLVNFQQVLLTSRDKNVTKLALMATGDYYFKQEFWTKAKQYYLQANEKDPDNYDIHFTLAKIDTHLGQTDDAKKHLRIMQKINPASLEAKVLQAGLLVEEEDYDKAVQLYREVINTKDDDYETRISLAKVFLQRQQFSEALGELLQAYKFNADYYYTYYYRGLANRGLGDLTESERNFLKVVQLNPKFYKAHFELGQTYLRKDDMNKAMDEMDKALELEPKFTGGLVALGDYCYDHGSFTQANQYYALALKSEPNRPELILKQAKTYHEMGNDQKSIGLFQKILQLKPTSSMVYFELGILFEENNNEAQALQAYQKSVALSPKDPKPYYQMGFLYKDLRQNAKAIAAFRKFLELSPNAIDKVDIEDQIQKLSGR